MQEAVPNSANVVHKLFTASVVIKGFNGVWEIVVGLLFLLARPEAVQQAFLRAGTAAVVQGSGQFVSSQVMRHAQSFSESSQYFIAWYFLLYGALNIFLVIFLSRGKLWAYPVSMACFTLFILYQIRQVLLYHSGLLLLFTIFDILLVVVTYLEYLRVKRMVQYKKD